MTAKNPTSPVPEEQFSPAETAQTCSLPATEPLKENRDACLGAEDGAPHCETPESAQDPAAPAQEAEQAPTAVEEGEPRPESDSQQDAVQNATESTVQEPAEEQKTEPVAQQEDAAQAAAGCTGQEEIAAEWEEPRRESDSQQDAAQNAAEGQEPAEEEKPEPEPVSRQEDAAQPAAERSGQERQAEEKVDFSEEDAMLAAQDAGLELGDETPEEQAEAEEAAGKEPIEGENDLTGKSKSELVALFGSLLESRPVQSLRKDAEAIKIAFYKLHRAETEAKRREFTEQGGTAEEFVPAPDGDEIMLKELFARYRRRRDEFIANLETAKEENLKVKLAIIESLKELVDSNETLNHTFAQFRDLQRRWKETGPVPQAQVKDLWETYNLHVEHFYNFIKINKELRDLDLKKNYEAKVALCEAAEALVLEPSVLTAFHKLQKLHDEWRETGPVANEYKEALWDRFKEASARINKQHQAYFESLKEEQTSNLQLKTELCVKAEELSGQAFTTRKEWNRASDQLLEIQKVWKTIGFAPKKDNNRIYERFRSACDRFFAAKREFYAGLKSEMEHNLQLKIEICQAAEALQQSEEWKRATDELIALQKQWKQIGPVSRRHSDAIWKRFRAACDRFFERKSAHFSSVDDEHEENLRRKQALLEEMEACDVQQSGYDAIREFQRRWSEIGFVPIKRKESIQKRYKEVVDRLFSELRGSERERSMDRFRSKVSGMRTAGSKRLGTERERLYNKVRQLEADIAVLENNIGFFAHSKNAEEMIRDVREKIERAKTEMAETIEKVKLIDRQQEKEE